MENILVFVDLLKKVILYHNIIRDNILMPVKLKIFIYIYISKNINNNHKYGISKFIIIRCDRNTYK